MSASMLKLWYVGDSSGSLRSPSRYCATCRVVGRAPGSGCEHSSPSLSTRLASSSTTSPPRRGSTAPVTVPARHWSRTQSTSTRWLSRASCTTGFRPHATSSMKAPSANTSDALEAFPVCPSSGARYPMVPTTCVVCGSVPWSYSRASPKSPSRPFMSASSSTLLALMSRCTTTCSQSSWRYSSPEATPLMIRNLCPQPRAAAAVFFFWSSYRCLPNGSLDKYLHDKTKPVLDWSQRFQIIRGVASGLLYLHEDWDKIVIHRDIKASNVLLDADMNGRLGDFGLARLYDHGVDPQTTHVVGTMGYLAPELVRTGKATPVTDVFAFGVFVLEVTCGRRPLGCIAPDEQNVLLDWVQEHERRRAGLDTVDPRLCGKYDADEARLAIKLGLMCAHPLPDARPGMRQVTQYLEGEVAMPEVVPTFLSYTTLALMQNDGFDSFAMSFPSTVTTDASPTSGDVSAVSGLSGGR
uniref:Protein kinase domain-containing protein n=1 Tax=Aegilops tauschii subsp. strangulata TaxID=200361 RepID=A0A453CFY2_AEGTS